MSTGLVICSICNREVHQAGDRDIRNGWLHCEDHTVICVGGNAAYPESMSEIKGKFCGRDDDARLSNSMEVVVQPRKRHPLKMAGALAALLAIAAGGEGSSVPYGGAARLPRIRRSNKYMHCACGCGKLERDCDGGGKALVDGEV